MSFIAILVLSAACVGFSSPKGWSPPQFEDGNAFVFLDEGRLSALAFDETDSSRARELWRFPNDDLYPLEDGIDLKAVYGPPVFVEDFIILAAFSGEIVAITRDGRYEPGSGSWKISVPGEIIGTAVVAEGRLVFATSEGRLYVRDVVTGGGVAPWPVEGKELGASIWASPIVSDGVVITATMKGTVQAFNLETGVAVWDAPFQKGSAIAGLALINENVLFVPGLGGIIDFIDVESGQSIGQSFETEGWVWSQPLVKGGILYFGDFAGNLYALDIAKGINVENQVWPPISVGGKIKAKPVIIGQTMVLADEDATVHFIDIEKGSIDYSFSLIDTADIFASVVEYQGFAWIVSENGELFRADPEVNDVKEVSILKRSD
tara:strand:+ start:407 stop:1537 length:1131 start_codon:yes stop_codon:yes gene_type:complete